MFRLLLRFKKQAPTTHSINAPPRTRLQFEIQIQGKFTRVPTGTVYIGGEITEGPMSLGLVTRGLCNMLLGFARRINGAMNYSYGDGGQLELPHIVFPLWTSVDKVRRAFRGHLK